MKPRPAIRNNRDNAMAVLVSAWLACMSGRGTARSPLFLASVSRARRRWQIGLSRVPAESAPTGDAVLGEDRAKRDALSGLAPSSVQELRDRLAPAQVISIPVRARYLGWIRFIVVGISCAPPDFRTSSHTGYSDPRRASLNGSDRNASCTDSQVPRGVSVVVRHCPGAADTSGNMVWASRCGQISGRAPAPILITRIWRGRARAGQSSLQVPSLRWATARTQVLAYSAVSLLVCSVGPQNRQLQPRPEIDIRQGR